MLTSSLGWIGFLLPSVPPASSIARFEMTSLAFILVWVPLPVCQTRNGNSASSLPEATSSAACTISRALSAGSLPRSWLTSAAAFLSRPKARIIERGIRSGPILK